VVDTFLSTAWFLIVLNCVEFWVVRFRFGRMEMDGWMGISCIPYQPPSFFGFLESCRPSAVSPLVGVADVTILGRGYLLRT